MNKKNKAIELFRRDYNCSQSVLTVFSDVTGINEADSKKIASGFGGGIGRTQRICGALTGAVMVIGCKYHNDSDPLASKKNVYKKAQDFLNEFKKINEHISCYNLTGVDFSTEEGMKKAHDEKIFEIKCEKYVADVIELLERLVVSD
jgi:C_GCAxxG_C_C family probable redox protein